MWCAALVLVTGAATAEPYRPADDDQVLERLPAPGDATTRELRRLRNELAAQPGNLDLAIGLARRYMEIGRAESDPRYDGYAQATLAPWWNLPEAPTEVVVLRAVLRQRRHDFAGARADLDRVLAVDPGNAQAWLTRAVVLQVQSDFGEARESCERLRRRVHPMIFAACLAGIDGRNGNAVASHAFLQQMVERDPDADPGLRLWALTILAETAAQIGEAEAAERHFHEAFALGRRNVYLIGAYADFLLDQGRPAVARDLLAEETRADGTLLRLAIAKSRLGDPAAEGHTAALAARFDASRRRGDSIHLREQARFTLELLKEPQEALRLAKANWQKQREPWDARLVLEAALAAAAPDEAAPVVAWVRQTRLEDVRIQTLIGRLEKPAG